MKRFLRRRGQAAVEFSLLLPFFMLVLFSTIYVGFFVLDYVTLDNAAAKAARAAALNEPTYKIPSTIWQKVHDTELFSDWYEQESDSPTSEIITDAEGNEYVQVKIKTKFAAEKEGSILKDVLPNKGYGVLKMVKLEKST